ncbi:tyrosine-type recombinase/integrase [Alkaliphilus metalliredigens]|nr:tyrosine-type recombinase/integrase [Alkaliphilus metalliredigens]
MENNIEKLDRVVLLDSEMRIVDPVYNYLKYQKSKGRSDNTLLAQARDLKLYWEFLETNRYTFDQITPYIIGHFIEFLRNDEHGKNIIHIKVSSVRAGKTINRILTTIHNLYIYIVNTMEIRNPILMEEIKRPPNMFKDLLHHTRSNNKTHRSIFKVKEVNRAVRLITNDEADTFVENLVRWRDRLIFKIMYISGARIQEVLDLKIEQIPTPDPTSMVAVLENIKSKGKNRDLYMPMYLLEEIDNFIMEERNQVDTVNSFIFVSYQTQYLGKKLTYRGIYEVFNRVKKKTGIYFNFHDLRHTCVTNFVESGLDISVVQKIAGHKHVTTTENYTHLSKKHINKVISKYWNDSSMC